MAPEIIKAMELSGVKPNENLYELANKFKKKVLN